MSTQTAQFDERVFRTVDLCCGATVRSLRDAFGGIPLIKVRRSLERLRKAKRVTAKQTPRRSHESRGPRPMLWSAR